MLVNHIILNQYGGRLSIDSESHYGRMCQKACVTENSLSLCKTFKLWKIVEDRKYS